MANGHRKFNEVMAEAKRIIADNNISFDEIEKNTGVDATFTRILFDPTTGAADNIDKIFEFIKLRMVPRRLAFRPYKADEKGSGIYLIKRTQSPKSSMYYDRNKDKFYRFKYYKKSVQHSEVYTDIIKNEMQEFIFKYLKEKR